jgi:hypothetical protein
MRRYVRYLHTATIIKRSLAIRCVQCTSYSRDIEGYYRAIISVDTERGDKIGKST